MVFWDSADLTNRFYVENWVYKGLVEYFCVRCLHSLYISPLLTGTPIIGDVNSGHEKIDFTLIYTRRYRPLKPASRTLTPLRGNSGCSETCRFPVNLQVGCRRRFRGNLITVIRFQWNPEVQIQLYPNDTGVQTGSVWIP